MVDEMSRDYSCKDEVLILVCNFAAFSLKRDLSVFKDYSPKFNESYVTEFEKDIAAAKDLIEPESETQELKINNKKLSDTLDNVLVSGKRLKGYVKMAGPSIPVVVNDFGFSPLFKAIKSRKTADVIDQLHTVTSNMLKYKDILAVQGLTDGFVTRFLADESSIANDKQKQYEIKMTRKAIIQNNIVFFNALYATLSEILAVGKILFRGNDALKTKEYTFAELKRQVRRTTKPKKENKVEPKQ